MFRKLRRKINRAISWGDFPRVDYTFEFSKEQKAELSKKYDVYDYQFSGIQEGMNFVNFKDKRILEIGGSNIPAEIVFEILGAKQWVCIDLIHPYQIERNPSHYKKIAIHDLDTPEAEKILKNEQYVIFRGKAEDSPECFRNHFEGALSICAFEHIYSMSSMLEKLTMSLQPQARFFTKFSPIWSSYCGHHMWLNDELNFNNLGPIPDFAHLLMSYSELFDFLKKHYDTRTAEAVTFQMKSQEYTNKLFYEDYVYFMKHSGFAQHKIEKIGRRTVAPYLQRQLEKRYPGCKAFDTMGLYIYAIK